MVANKKEGKQGQGISYILRSKASFLKTKVPQLFLLTTFLTLLLILPVYASVSDSGATYGFPTVDAQGTGTQGGTGFWESAVPTTTGISLNLGDDRHTPLMINLDQSDNDPEVLVQNQDVISVYNIDETTGTFLLITSVDIGTITDTGITRTVTPGWLRHNSTHHHIITANASHVLDYWFDGSTFTLNGSTTASCNVLAGTFSHATHIICDGVTSQWTDGNQHCFFPTAYQGANNEFRMCHFNVNDTYADAYASTGSGASMSGKHQDYNIVKVVDYDVINGVKEALYSFIETSFTPADIRIWSFAINSTSNITQSELYFHNNAGAGHNSYTDLLVSNLDGSLSNGYELSWGYQATAPDWEVRTVSPTGAVLEDDYDTLLTAAPEGDWSLKNLLNYPFCADNIGSFAQDDTQSALVVHDNAAGESTIMCFTLTGGMEFVTSTYTDTSDFTSSRYGVVANLYSDSQNDMSYAGTLFKNVAGSGQTLNNILSTGGMTHTLPIDAFTLGSLDLLMVNNSGMFLYDDNVLNANVVLNPVSVSSGNPVCNNSKVIFTLPVTDAENDFHDCYMDIEFVNGTDVYNTSSLIKKAPYSHVFQHTFVDGIEAYNVEFLCADQFHDVNVTGNYPLTTATSPGCNEPFQNPTEYDFENITITLTPTQQAQDDAIDSTLNILFGSSTNVRLIVGLAMIIGIMVYVAMVTGSGFASAGAGLIMTIMTTAIGLINAYILILILVGLILMVLLGRQIMGSNEGGG